MKIITCSTENLEWEDISEYKKFVSIQRQQKIDRFKFENDKITSLISGLIVQMDICQNLKISPEFSFNEHGKPCLKNSDNYFFSISHSKNMVAFARSDKPVGIDTEFISNLRENVQKKYFTESENKFIQNSKDKNKAFFRIWTSKEAFVKMIGTGLSKPLNSFDVLSAHMEKNFFSFENKGYMFTACCENIVNAEIELTKIDANTLLAEFSQQI